MKNIVIFLFLLVVFASCKKTINGTIKDNFNNPVEGVKVSISNSGYEALSNKKGEFKIEYAAGKFQINFEKENHIPINKELEIIEQTSYEMGQINIIRVPDSSGFYYKGYNNFVPLRMIKLNSKTESHRANFISFTKTYYSWPTDSVLEIEVDSLNEAEFYHRGNLFYVLTSSKNESVATYSKYIYSYMDNVSAVPVNYTYNKLGLNTIKWVFRPEFNTNYYFLEYKEEPTKRSMNGNAYAIKFIKKK